MVLATETVVALAADGDPHEKDVIAGFDSGHPGSHLLNDASPFMPRDAGERGIAKDTVPHGDVSVTQTGGSILNQYLLFSWRFQGEFIDHQRLLVLINKGSPRSHLCSFPIHGTRFL
jgi:hypothetical protein